MPQNALPTGLLQASNILKQRDRSKSSLPLLKYAFSLDSSSDIAKAGYWAGLKHGDNDFSRTCLDFLESQPDGKNREWLQGKRRKLKSQPLSPQDVTEWVQRSEQGESYDPIAGKICYILHNSLPFASGGYATRAHGMAAGLRANGLEVVCMTRPGFPIDVPNFDLSRTIPPEEAIDDIQYVYTPEPSRKQFSGREYVWQAANKLTEIFHEMRPAKIMAASNYITAIPALVAARRLGIPFFYEIRGFWEVTRVSREPEYAKTDAYAQQVALEKAVADHADHVFTLTTPMKEEMIERGVAAEKITLAPNSCDPFRFNPQPRDAELAAKYGIPEGVPVIGYIGTFVQYEGLEHLAQACALLRAQGQDFRLLLVGNENTAGNDRGPITEEILRVANEEGLADKLIMPGRIPHEEVEAHYSLIDIAPFPRKPQPVTEMVSPMKPLEALAMEKAVLVSSVRALTEMVQDGKTGLVFEKGNVDDMARVLARLIADSDLRSRLGKAGRQWVEAERTWDKTATTVAGMIGQFTPQGYAQERTAPNTKEKQ